MLLSRSLKMGYQVTSFVLYKGLNKNTVFYHDVKLRSNILHATQSIGHLLPFTMCIVHEVEEAEVAIAVVVAVAVVAVAITCDHGEREKEEKRTRSFLPFPRPHSPQKERLIAGYISSNSASSTDQ